MTTWQERMAWILTHRLSWPKNDLVYHAKGYETREGEAGNLKFTKISRCGLEIDKYERGRVSHTYTMFDQKIASLIARPCKHCYEVKS